MNAMKRQKSFSLSAYGMPLLSYACTNGYLATAMLLVEKGARVNFCGAQGAAFLIAALESEHPDVVKFLVENGADINAKGDNGMSPLFWHR